MSNLSWYVHPEVAATSPLVEKSNTANVTTSNVGTFEKSIPFQYGYSAEVDIEKIIDHSPVFAGEDVVFTINLTNPIGPSTAQDVTLIDTLDPNIFSGITKVTLNGDDITQQQGVVNGLTVTVNAGNINKNGLVAITIECTTKP